MEETQEPLTMTVHLLANSGHGSLLQQTLDQLLDCICPEVRLFMVSERVSPVKNYDKCHPKRSRFPGMSVLLFLRASLGEERLFRVLDSLQQWPWHGYPAPSVQGSPGHSVHARQEFYSLDSQMPVWGVRQLHCGAEILRVTLYCTFDNYEDAIGLYQMILQREATLQKSNFCFFVLYATEHFALQLSLKQLPLGMSVDPKEASVLQFKVQEIGQLVPLLPHPCVPISRTRWQTQDYEGNKILLQIQSNAGIGIRNGTSRADTLPQGSRVTPAAIRRALELRRRRSRGRRFKVASLEFLEPNGTPVSDGPDGTLWGSPGCPFQVSSPVTHTQLSLHSPQLEPAAGMKVFSQKSSSEKLEAETNVDTGCTVVNSRPRQSLLSRFPRDPQTSQAPPASTLGTAASKSNRILKECIHPFSPVGQRDLGARKIIPKCPLQLPVQGEEKGEEFFI